MKTAGARKPGTRRVRRMKRRRSDPAVTSETGRLRRPLRASLLDLLRSQIQYHPIRAHALDRRLGQIDLIKPAEPVLDQARIKQEVVSAAGCGHIHVGVEDPRNRPDLLAVRAEDFPAL